MRVQVGGTAASCIVSYKNPYVFCLLSMLRVHVCGVGACVAYALLMLDACCICDWDKTVMQDVNDELRKGSVRRVSIMELCSIDSVVLLQYQYKFFGTGHKKRSNYNTKVWSSRRRCTRHCSSRRSWTKKIRREGSQWHCL